LPEKLFYERDGGCPVRVSCVGLAAHRRLPLYPDCVAKVENRTTLKISRKLIFRLLCCCVAIQRRYEGPWSILDKSIWSLTSPRSIRISSSKKFRSSPQKEFFNTIPSRTDVASRACQVRKVPRGDIVSHREKNEPPTEQNSQICATIETPVAGTHRVKHRAIDYDVQEVEPGLWRWNIYPGNRKVQGPSEFRTRERAVEACLAEINNGIERTQKQAARSRRLFSGDGINAVCRPGGDEST
jgi:hypothetical protein